MIMAILKDTGFDFCSFSVVEVS